MIIRKVYAEQFAGISDKEIELSTGLNVVIGKNESGKSTLTSLVSELLFRSAKLDGRSAKEFVSSFFPAKNVDGKETGDFIGGSISFECNGESYTLSRQWGTQPNTVLKTPEGAFKDEEKISDRLKELLSYGRGVYAELLFPSKRASDAILMTLMDRKAVKDKTELTAALTKAFVQTDGVALDRIESAITEKIQQLGKYWDIEKGKPVRNTGGEKRTKGIGLVLSTYYAQEDARSRIEEMHRLESSEKEISSRYTVLLKDFEERKRQRTEFESYARIISERRSAERMAEMRKRAVREYEEALASWPSLLEGHEKANLLLSERERYETIKLHCEATALSDRAKDLYKLISESKKPSEAEILEVKSCEREAERLMALLGGMNVNAQIKKLCENAEVSVRRLIDGSEIELFDDGTEINEAVIIEIPNLLEIKLSPSSVDTQKVKSELDAALKRRDELLSVYGVDSSDEMSSILREQIRLEAELDNISSRLRVMLNGRTLEEISDKIKEYEKNGLKTRTELEITADIRELCGNGDISRFAMLCEAKIRAYTDRYGSINEALRLCSVERDELARAQDALQKCGEIPEKFLSVGNPEAHLEALVRAEKDCETALAAASEQRTEARVRLEVYMSDTLGGKTQSDLSDELSEANKAHERAVALLDNWCYIREVFLERKKALSGSPMQDIAEKFSEYLDRISGGVLATDLFTMSVPSPGIIRNGRALDFDKLSEGTKETVMTAFRLAVLEHLFPDGGGVMVLDDPFANMDSERCRRACTLVRELSEKHQIIFFTCRDEYREMLPGSFLEIS